MSAATTYYVRTDGSDANTGTVNSAGGAWRNPAKCASTATTPGDTCRVQDGTYVSASFRFSSPGSAGNYITMLAEHRGLAIISSTAGCNGVIEINTSYIHIDGIRTQINAANVPCATGHNSSDGTGVRIFSNVPTVAAPDTNNHHNWVSYTTHDASSQRSHSIKCGGDYCLAEYNTAYNGIEAGAGHDMIARNNIVLGQDGFGSGLVWAKFGNRNAQAYDNYVECTNASETCFIIGGSSADGNHFDEADDHECYSCVAVGNVIKNVATSGTVFVGTQGGQDILFAFNTFTGNANMSLWYGNGGGSTPAIPKNITWKNNVVSLTGPCTNSITNFTGTSTFDYNDFYLCTSAPSQTHTVSGNPLLNADFSLQAGSPLIDAAVTLTTWPAYSSGTITFDLSPPAWSGAPTCGTRPSGVGYDVGACEFSDVTPPSAPTGISVVSVGRGRKAGQH